MGLAGYVACMGKWYMHTFVWNPEDRKRVKRPACRWDDDDDDKELMIKTIKSVVDSVAVRWRPLWTRQWGNFWSHKSWAGSSATTISFSWTVLHAVSTRHVYEDGTTEKGWYRKMLKHSSPFSCSQRSRCANSSRLFHDVLPALCSHSSPPRGQSTPHLQYTSLHSFALYWRVDWEHRHWQVWGSVCKTRLESVGACYLTHTVNSTWLE
jgi:hypothetical protein